MYIAYSKQYLCTRGPKNPTDIKTFPFKTIQELQSFHFPQGRLGQYKYYLFYQYLLPIIDSVGHGKSQSKGGLWD